jgi:sulfur carrier protein ThiS
MGGPLQVAGQGNGGAGLVDLLKDLVIPETFLVAVDDLVVPDAEAGVAVL